MNKLHKLSLFIFHRDLILDDNTGSNKFYKYEHLVKIPKKFLHTNGQTI